MTETLRTGCITAINNPDSIYSHEQLYEIHTACNVDIELGLHLALLDTNGYPIFTADHN